MTIDENDVMRNVTLSKTGGFTLIEALIGGVLSILVLMSVATLFNLNSRQISGSFAHSQARIQHQIVMDQITASVHLAAFVGMSNPDNSGSVSNLSDSVCLFDSNGVFSNGFKRTGTTLKEWKSGWVDFKIGNASVKVTNSSVDSLFVVNPDKKSVQVRLNVFVAQGSTNDTFGGRWMLLRCRNVW